jgi:hypothetical protein
VESRGLLDQRPHLLGRKRAHRFRADVSLGAQGQQCGRSRFVVGRLDHADDVVLPERPIGIYEPDLELLELLLDGALQLLFALHPPSHCVRGGAGRDRERQDLGGHASERGVVEVELDLRQRRGIESEARGSVSNQLAP